MLNCKKHFFSYKNYHKPKYELLEMKEGEMNMILKLSIYRMNITVNNFNKTQM